MTSEQKKDRYTRCYSQIEELIHKTSDFQARMATSIAVLHHKFKYFFWTGYYRLIEGELTVSSYQGSLACLVLKKDTGVCWECINIQQSILVKDVEKFPGHIACDSRSKSEICIPIFKNDEIYAVLDVDSKDLNSFDEVDQKGLEAIINLVTKNAEF